MVRLTKRTRGIDGDALLQWVKTNCTIDDDGCWLWNGHIDDKGYGKMKYRGRVMKVHQVTSILAGKPAVAGEWDHTCRKRACGNPECTEDVSHAENVRRGNLHTVSAIRSAQLTHCPAGHPYSGENLYVDPKGYRRCRVCATINQQRRRKRSKPQTAAPRDRSRK